MNNKIYNILDQIIILSQSIFVNILVTNHLVHALHNLVNVINK